jgi:hypothetical protein
LVFVIVGLLLAGVVGWLWMDPFAGIVGLRRCKLVVWPHPEHRGHPD